MKRSLVIGLALFGAIGLTLIPELIPTGPVGGPDASSLLNSGRMWLAAGAIFLGGLGTSLTPCVYPLIPITVGVFGARQADSRGRALVLTTAYVVGMGLVFSALGIFAALSGRAFGSVLGSSLVKLALAAFMIILATSMFGAFEIALPSGAAAKLSGVGGGGVIGALLMGSAAGFLAAPCTGPVLSGVLTWVSQTKDPVIGGGLLFIYALGIGVPFFLIGVFTVRLPKGGEWMEWVKSVFGILLLGMAAGYLSDAVGQIPERISAVAESIGRQGSIGIAAGLALVGILMGAVHLSFKEQGERWLKAVGVVMVLGAYLLRLAAPTAHEAPPPSDQVAAVVPEFEWKLTFQADKEQAPDSFDAVLAQAKADCRPVMIDFFADWCAACKELDKLTYTDAKVKTEADRFVKVKVDGTEDHPVLDGLYERFGVKGLPTVAFIDPMGQVLTSPKVTGFMAPANFVGELQKVAVATCSRTP